MQIAPLLHTDHPLEHLAGEFEHWRQPRAHPAERLPKRLWKPAAALARVLPYSRVAQHVRVSPSDLKKHMAQGMLAPALGFVRGVADEVETSISRRRYGP